MAPAAGQLQMLIARNTKAFKSAWRHATKLVQDQLPASFRSSQAQLQPAFARNRPKHPVHRIALLKQSKGRWDSTHTAIAGVARRFTSSSSKPGACLDRSTFPKSRTGDIINAQVGRAPFASTLRPDLTGGTLARTAGGYAWGSGRAGGARYFSHSPTAPAQVVNNVSQAVRAFFFSGQKASFDGADPHTGEKRFRSVSALQQQVDRKLGNAPRSLAGSSVDFHISPTITALTTRSAAKGFSPFAKNQNSINQDDLIHLLSIDFARAWKELAAVLQDIQCLSTLGDLPISYESSVIKVHFPGCDAKTVENICNEVGVRRGVVHEDPNFDAVVGTEIALLFPFASSSTPSECSFFEKSLPNRKTSIDWQQMMSSPSIGITADGNSICFNDSYDPALSPSGYESLHMSDVEGVDNHSPLEYQGIEGIYRFMEQCEVK